METLTLNNGIQMPLVGFGTWDVRGETGKQAILTALELGYRLLDTAQMYDNEEIVGQAVQESGLPRQEIFITTKLYRPSASYQKAKAGIKKSLQALQTDYIDLLLIQSRMGTRWKCMKHSKRPMRQARYGPSASPILVRRNMTGFCSTAASCPPSIR